MRLVIAATCLVAVFGALVALWALMVMPAEKAESPAPKNGFSAVRTSPESAGDFGPDTAALSGEGGSAVAVEGGLAPRPDLMGIPHRVLPDVAVGVSRQPPSGPDPQRPPSPQIAGSTPNAAPASSFSADLPDASGQTEHASTAGTPGNMSLDASAVAVPQGAQLPALFHDDRALPPPQRRALDLIANEFIDAVAAAPAGSDRVAVWNEARAAADRRYITLFGHAAYNARHMEAAKEAVREKKSVSASQTAP